MQTTLTDAAALTNVRGLRLTCKAPDCGTVTELSIEDIARMKTTDLACPLCRKRLFNVRDECHPAALVVKAVRAAMTLTRQAEIELLFE